MRKRNAFAGTGQVFRFTMAQLLKSKANLRSLIFMLILALVSIPLISLLRGNANRSSDTTLYIENRTAVSLNGFASFMEERGFGGITITEGTAPEKLKNACALRLNAGEGGQLAVSILSRSGSGFSSDDDLYASCLASYAYIQQLKDSGLSDEEIRLLTSQPSHWSSTFSDYKDEVSPSSSPEEPGQEGGEEHEDEGFNQNRYTVQLGFSVILMMICIFSISFVIRAVVEEKSSKLVDLLLVSVNPGALLFGKVLAALLYALLYYVALIGGMVLSTKVCSLFMDLSATTNYLTNILNLKLSPDVLIILIVTSLLGFLAFGILAGLCGAGCSSIEESSNAMSLCMLLIMVGYMVSIMATAGGMTSSRTANIFCIVPVLSMFCSPTLYMFGAVTFWPVLIGWAVQLLFIFLLLLLAGRVYSGLIIYKGKRLGFMQILRMGLGKGAVS